MLKTNCLYFLQNKERNEKTHMTSFCYTSYHTTQLKKRKVKKMKKEKKNGGGSQPGKSVLEHLFDRREKKLKRTRNQNKYSPFLYKALDLIY